MKLSTLNEALSPEVYHFTSIVNAISILKDNRFRLSSALVSSVEQKYVKNDRYFYLSTTRSKLGNYGANNYVMIAFVLDGTKLNHTYHGFPLEYYGKRDFRNSPPEHEDRLSSKSPYIDNANKYIKRVDIYLSNGALEKYTTNGYLQTLIDYANADNVKVYVYKNKDSFNASKNGIEGNEFIKSYGQNVKNDIGPNMDDVLSDALMPYVNALKGENLDEESTSKIIYLAKYHSDDLPSKIKSDFNINYRTDSARILTQLCMKLGLKSINDIVKYLKDKYSTKK